jgi:glycosyltransferase involved in cell wall biosynthesis
LYSIVIPVYRNEDSLPDLTTALDTVASRIEDLYREQVEVIFVVDASPDRSFDRLAETLPRCTFSSKLLLHSRNFGSFPAIRSGLLAASGDFCGVMAADLQEPPELMIEFLAAVRNGDCDVVVGCRENRADPPVSRALAGVFWNLYRWFVIAEIPTRGVDVFGCTRAFRDHLLRLEESNSSLVGLIFWLGFRRRNVFYSRRPRLHGRSAWTLRKKLKYLFDSVYSFTDLPIRLLIGLGVLGLAVSLVLAVVVLIARLVGGIAVPGYAATALVVLFFGGLNTLGLGIVGTYAWRAFENTKRRPLALLQQVVTFSGLATTRTRAKEGRPA